jgi:hypothetical protein
MPVAVLQAETLLIAYEVEITNSTKLFPFVFKPVINRDLFRILMTTILQTVNRKSQILPDTNYFNYL